MTKDGRKSSCLILDRKSHIWAKWRVKKKGHIRSKQRASRLEFKTLIPIFQVIQFSSDSTTIMSSTSNLCNLCGLSFREEWQLRNHTQKIHDDQILKCNICEEEVIGKYRLASHKNKHKQQACSLCFKLVPTNSYTAHRTKCDAQVLFCDHCPYQTPKTALLKKHQKSMHEEKEPKSKNALDKILHVCPHCNFNI